MPPNCLWVHHSRTAVCCPEYGCATSEVRAESGSGEACNLSEEGGLFAVLQAEVWQRKGRQVTDEQLAKPAKVVSRRGTKEDPHAAATPQDVAEVRLHRCSAAAAVTLGLGCMLLFYFFEAGSAVPSGRPNGATSVDWHSFASGREVSNGLDCVEVLVAGIWG